MFYICNLWCGCWKCCLFMIEVVEYLCFCFCGGFVFYVKFVEFVICMVDVGVYKFQLFICDILICVFMGVVFFIIVVVFVVMVFIQIGQLFFGVVFFFVGFVMFYLLGYDLLIGVFIFGFFVVFD